MPNMETYKRRMEHLGNTVGQAHKYNSDLVMEMTWDNDIQSKKCYIYDFFHDNQPELNRGMSYSRTTKTPIDAKFIITQYGTLAKDQVEYHIQFRPSQAISFSEHDELYYFETEYKKKYGNEFPIGLFIDIPDDMGTYNKWLICSKEIGNQFIKYSVLPCSYNLMWIEENGDRRIKRKMWCVLRNQNSYNSGLWNNYYITTVENQNKLWLPLNSITENIGYVYKNGSRENQRLLISALNPNPTAWKVSKIENAQPFGLQKITVAQDMFNPSTDYVNLETGEMFADYWGNKVEPVLPEKSNGITAKISTATGTIRCGGSYKTLTLTVTDTDGNDITGNYKESLSASSWKFSIDGTEIIPNNGLIIVSPHEDFNKIKVKLVNDRSYLEKLLTIRCVFDEGISETNLEITA